MKPVVNNREMSLQGMQSHGVTVTTVGDSDSDVTWLYGYNLGELGLARNSHFCLVRNFHSLLV